MAFAGHDGAEGGLKLPDEIAFLAGFGVDPRLLLYAARAAERVGVTADLVLLKEGHLSAGRFYGYLARHLGVPVLDHPLPAHPLAALPEGGTVEIAPLRANARGLAFAMAPRGATLGLLLRRFAAGLWRADGRVGMTTPQRLNALVRAGHDKARARRASEALDERHADLSARKGPNAGQRMFLAALLVAAALGLWRAPGPAAQVIGFLCSLVFLAVIAIRLLAMAASPPPGRNEAARRPDRLLPVYTVVVALYREAKVVPALVTALLALDYPAAKLDIKLVVEADDAATREALERLGLPERFEIMVAPPGAPKTKPRALNVALPGAIGRYLVVFDAEDRPAPDQLRVAVEAFEADRAGTLGCLQGRLVIDNPDESWLAALFALEYAALFEVINPGLARLGLPLPLGGTSNHFPTKVLRAVYGWDAWNVTEDIDLGIRLARFGHRVAMLPSRTTEEATYTLRAWLRQRRRWQKGWIVTLQTHTRDLDRLFGQLGPRQALAILALLGGTVLSASLFPLFVLAVVVDAACGPLLHPATAWECAASLWTGLLTLGGALAVVGPIVMGWRRHRLPALGASLLRLPLYLALVSLATWQAWGEALWRPHLWAKTEHGLSRRRAPPAWNAFNRPFREG